MLDSSQIKDKLKGVIDPELRINIVDLGLVYDVKVNHGRVVILMTLTSPGCPLAPVFEKMVKDKLMEMAEIKQVEVRLTFEPLWTPERMSQEAKMSLGWG